MGQRLQGDGKVVRGFLMFNLRVMDFYDEEDSNNKRNFSKGITLIELLVVISIIAIISTISMFAASKYAKKYKVVENMSQIYADLNALRFKSMSSGIPYGIRFNSPTKYTLFKLNDKNYNLIYDGIVEEAPCKICETKTIDFSITTDIKTTEKVFLFDDRGVSRDINWSPGNGKDANGNPENFIIHTQASIPETRSTCIKIGVMDIRSGMWKNNSCILQ